MKVRSLTLLLATFKHQEAYALTQCLADNPSTLPPNSISIPKNRSTGHLPSSEARAPATGRIRFSVDGSQSSSREPHDGSGSFSATTPRPPILPEHEHGLGVSGLRRIRQHPLSRAPTLPPSPSSSFALPSRASSMTLNLMSARSCAPATGGAGPSTPTIGVGEDLTRFPSESLHSFSFAQQSEDLLHSRATVVRRSIEFMRDRGWLASHPGLVRAQAKIAGDVEVQSMLELLSRANLLGDEALSSSGPDAGLGIHAPLTGPPNIEGDNVFERDFVPQVESPEHLKDLSAATGLADAAESTSRPESSLPNRSQADRPRGPTEAVSPMTMGQSSVARAVEASAVRTGLKRTYTDTAPLTLQTKLTEALAKPYKTSGSSVDSQLAVPLDGAQAMALPKPLPTSTAAPIVSAHGPSQRWAPAAQAIFTTEPKAPWTILAANDLACLVFGVTRAEVRKLGMLEMVRRDWRPWLEDKLNAATPLPSPVKTRSPTTKSARTSPTPTSSLSMRGGITAQLLSKPSSRERKEQQRRQTDDGAGSSLRHHVTSRSRGVLICGDVLPILKRNGSTGSASLWVKEKKGSLIWVLEEIVEDTAELTLDETGSVLSASGAVDIIWGGSANVERHDIRKLIPRAPYTSMRPKVIDYEALGKIKHFTAQSPDGYSLPVSVRVNATLGELTVSSFPHIAGIMVLSSRTLHITSSNAVFAAALFGQPRTDGLHITELIPQFAKMLDILVDEDGVELADGLVIPEHSFRRARALLALREGRADAAAIFLRPTGLGARHRDGSVIHVDVQMRVVRSETFVPEETIIAEEENGDADVFADAPSEAASSTYTATAETVYALWITYSRHLHSISRQGGPVPPLVSRPGTPPRQPSPGQEVVQFSAPGDESEQPASMKPQPEPPKSPNSLVSEQIREATAEPISAKPLAKTQNAMPKKTSPPQTTQPAVTPNTATETPPVHPPGSTKKVIGDFVILEDMGQGAYGQVKLARYKKAPAGSSGKIVLKYVTKKRILVDTWTRDRRLGTVPLEIHVLDYLRRDSLRHPNIVTMTDFFEDSVNYYIEMVPHGLPGMDLFDYIEMRATMNEAECRHIFLQVVSALHHLHVKALVVHRDIKDENIILYGENHVKLIDFGSAAYIKNGPFDVFVGTIGKPSRVTDIHDTDDCSRLRCTRSASGQVLSGQRARRVGAGHLALHADLQGEPLLQRR